MGLYHNLNWNIILPLSDLILGRNIQALIKFVTDFQWWDLASIEQYQREKLQELIKHAYENVPYYHKLFIDHGLKPSDIQDKNDLKKLPLLTKDDIRKNMPDQIRARNYPIRSIMFARSSGSTGEPLQFYRTKLSYGFSIAVNIRGWNWMSYRLGDKYVKLSQNPRSLSKHIQDLVNRTRYLYAQQLVDSQFEKLCIAINKYKPLFIRGYPDLLFFFSKYLTKTAKQFDFDLRAISTTGNILYPEARKTIQEAMNAVIFDAYSCEGTATIFECPTHSCYHIADECAISEILNNNKEVSAGEQGRLITTDLHNFAVPFIRFDTQDILVKSKKECTCGRKLASIDSIRGRDNDILITPSGKYLIVHNFTGYFELIKEIRQFQIYQPEYDQIIIRLKVSNDYNLSLENEILQYYQKYIGPDIRLRIEKVDEIPVTPSGKRRFLVRNPEIPLSL